VAIVGAGPAGLAAAVMLARHGIDVSVVDEQERPGGQIYRRPPASFGPVAGREPAAGSRLIEAAEAADEVNWLQGTTAWGVFYDEEDPDRLILGTVDLGRVRQVRARRLLLAPGAYDLPVAFPGWTLPGVMAVGGLQAFLKAQRLLVGRRIALIGAHPLLLVVAGQLLSAGADLGLVAFAQKRPSVVELARRFGARRGAIARAGDVIGPLRLLRERGVPLRFGTSIVAAEGAGVVERVIVGAVDAAWERDRSAELSMEVDTVALGYGFVPSTELARQAGCAYRWNPAAGGWVVAHDAWMATSDTRIFVAGEITGISGAEQSKEEGTLAAVGILRDLGRLSNSEAIRLARRVRRSVSRLESFNRALEAQFAPNLYALADLASDATIVCRCEEVTAGALRATLELHPHLGTLDAVKLLIRVGMGPCQGRFCQPAVAAIVARARGSSLNEVGPFAARAPVKPIRMRLVAAALGAADDE